MLLFASDEKRRRREENDNSWAKEMIPAAFCFAEFL
jgi:hypothetical protein